MQEAYNVGVEPRFPRREPGQRTMFLWALAMRWVQGVVAAFATLGVLDALGLTRKDWVQVIHAVGLRWMEGMQQFSRWLDARLPFGWNVGPYEATFLLLVLVTILPIAVAQAFSPRRSVELPERVLGFAGLFFVLYGMVILLAPGGMRDTPDVFSSAAAATCVGFILSVGMTGNGVVRRDVIGVAPIIVLITGRQLGWTTSNDGYLIALFCACLSAVTSIGFIMFEVARSYIVAFLAALGLVLVLELVSTVPGVGQQIIAYL